MTAGHKHRVVRVKRGSRLHRVLTRPTLRVATTDRADRSRFVYGPVAGQHGVPFLWRLSPLGVLHAMFGLTLDVRDE